MKGHSGHRTVAAWLLILAFPFAFCCCGGGDDTTLSSADSYQDSISDAGTSDADTSEDEGLVTPYLELSQTEYEVAASGGTIEVEVDSNAEFTVTIPVDWVVQDSSVGSTSTVTVMTFTVAANDGAESRSTVITLSGGNTTIEVYITQEGADT